MDNLFGVELKNVRQVYIRGMSQRIVVSPGRGGVVMNGSIVMIPIQEYDFDPDPLSNSYFYVCVRDVVAVIGEDQ